MTVSAASGRREGYHHQRLLQGVERTRAETRGCPVRPLPEAGEGVNNDTVSSCCV